MCGKDPLQYSLKVKLNNPFNAFFSSVSRYVVVILTGQTA